jgi:hypothetical protein
MAQNNRYLRPTGARDLARRTATGVFVAIVALLVTQALVDTVGVDVGATGEMSPFSAGPLVMSTIVAGVGAAVAYAGIVRFTDRAVRNFVVLASVVFIVMLVPVVVVTPTLDVTPTGQAILVFYHILVAVPLVAFITGMISL